MLKTEDNQDDSFCHSWYLTDLLFTSSGKTYKATEENWPTYALIPQQCRVTWETTWVLFPYMNIWNYCLFLQIFIKTLDRNYTTFPFQFFPDFHCLLLYLLDPTYYFVWKISSIAQYLLCCVIQFILKLI